MKKLCYIIIFMSFSISLSLVLASCDGIESLGNKSEENNEHIHSFEETYLYNEVSHWQECSCGVKRVEEQHTFIPEESILAVSIKTGNRIQVCSVCQYIVESEEIHQHTYSEEWTFDENTHYHLATCEHSLEKKDVSDHTYSSWIIVDDAQENVAGLKKRICFTCGYEQIEQIPALNHQHTYSEEWTIDEAPTCEKKGRKSRHCLTCEECTDITEISALGHNYRLWEIVQTPTLTSTGIIACSCSRDENHIKTISLPILNSNDYHYKVIEEATCESEGTEGFEYSIDGQTLCFLNRIEAKNHSSSLDWNQNDISHWLTCEECNKNFEINNHQYDENYNCVICGYIHNLGTPGLCYILTGDGTSYAVTNYFGSDTTVEVPEKYNNLPVSRIGEEVFSNQKIVEVKLPSGIKRIGKSAFDHCMMLNKINLPDGLVEIGAFAFDTCVNLKEIQIPDHVQSIGDSAFKACISLTEIILPDSVISIGASAFASCQRVTHITMSKNVKTIGKMAFSTCFMLEEIEIPSTIKIINSATFAHCKALESIILPEGVESISNNAFTDCYNLKRIVLPKSLTYIHNGSFYMCEELKEIYFTGSLQQWSILTKNGFNHYHCNPTIYTYSTNQPADGENCWYYNEQNQIIQW